MKNIFKKMSLFILTILLLTFITNTTDAYAWTVKSAVTRTDGTWLFPIASNQEYYLTDWAGCSANYSGSCIFGCVHDNWSDPTHSSALGHFGLDIGCGNVPVLATAAGTAYQGYCSGRGNYIVIEHPLNDGSGMSYYSVYEHLASFSVGNGVSVKAGTQIGIAGNSGASLGTHLHFEILLLKSGLGASLSNTNTLYTYENYGWVTSPSHINGLIVTNPSTANYSGTTCNMNSKPQWQSIPYHCGSVTYTYNASEVSIGKKVEPTTPTVTSNATKDQAGAWAKSRIGKYVTDKNDDGVYSNTDFIKEYSAYLGLSTLIGNPASYSTMTLPAGYTRIKNWSGADGFIPQKGDIGIWIGGEYGENGHAAIILDADGWDINEIVEVNSSGSTSSVAITSKPTTYSYFWGVIRPVYNTFTTTLPTELTSLKSALYGYDDVKLTWLKANNITGYAIYFKNNKSTPYYTLWKVTTATSINVPNLADGLKYTFKVAPYKIINGRVSYNTHITTSIYTLKKVTTPTVTKPSKAKVKIQWKGVTSASGYQISKNYYKSKTTIVKTLSSSYKSCTLSTSKTKKYYYKVRCYKKVNGKVIYGPWSSVVRK